MTFADVIERINKLSEEELLEAYFDAELYYHTGKVEDCKLICYLGEGSYRTPDYICLQIYRCVADKFVREVL